MWKAWGAINMPCFSVIEKQSKKKVLIEREKGGEGKNFKQQVSK